jgi:hypothetical protein
MTTAEILTKLNSTRSPDRRSAAKFIGKKGLAALGNDLLLAYERERTDPRSWETQTEMLKALGSIGHAPALPFAEVVVRFNEPHDMITRSAASCYVRLKRSSLADATPALELLSFGRLSVIDGALDPLGYDRMMPPPEQIEQLIKHSWDLHRHPDMTRGLVDARYGLAAACAGWEPALVRPFLEHCLSTGDVPVKHVAENSLKGKYVALR